MATPIPENDAELSIAELAAATGGEVRAGRHERVRGVTTDSRGEVSGKLFVALSGESFDGHDYVPDVMARGAAAVVVDRDVPFEGEASVVRVASTLDALGALARHVRRRWGGRVVAVGGSAGKTTTRGALGAALGALMGGGLHTARGNLNNRIGVPMVLFGLKPEHRLAVVEVGTNLRGEVAQIARVCEPDLAIVTLIAVEHAEGIGDLDAIEAEEGDLLAALGASGTALVNGDDARCVRQLERSSAHRKLRYGTSPDADYRIVERRPAGQGGIWLRLARPEGEPVELTTPLVGEPGALAVCAALAVAEQVIDGPLDVEAFARGLGHPTVVEPGRLVPIPLADGTLLLDDSYNANPASVQSSVRAARELAEQRGARLVLVVGEMRELGETSRGEHAQLGAWLAASGAELLVAVGGHAQLFVEPAEQAGIAACFAPDAAAAAKIATQRVQPGDVVLVKASRGVHSEQVVQSLREARGSAA